MAGAGTPIGREEERSSKVRSAVVFGVAPSETSPPLTRRNPQDRAREATEQRVRNLRPRSHQEPNLNSPAPLQPGFERAGERGRQFHRLDRQSRCTIRDHAIRTVKRLKCLRGSLRFQIREIPRSQFNNDLHVFRAPTASGSNSRTKSCGRWFRSTARRTSSTTLAPALMPTARPTAIRQVSGLNSKRYGQSSSAGEPTSSSCAKRYELNAADKAYRSSRASPRPLDSADAASAAKASYRTSK
jgi:hypothetical protein